MHQRKLTKAWNITTNIWKLKVKLAIFSVITPTVDCRVNLNSNRPDPSCTDLMTHDMYRPDPILGCPVSILQTFCSTLPMISLFDLTHLLSFMCSAYWSAIEKNKNAFIAFECFHPNKLVRKMMRKMKTRGTSSSQPVCVAWTKPSSSV